MTVYQKIALGGLIISSIALGYLESPAAGFMLFGIILLIAGCIGTFVQHVLEDDRKRRL